jgi:Serine dehydrogenase proteinase
MARPERKTILEGLEAELGMPVLAWATGDRENLETQISIDQIVRFPRHLDGIGQVDSVALLLYTRGGDTNVPWPVANFVRAYAKKVVTLVPFSAHSAGTLICLGADQILMSKIGTLSPIDPSVANAFNPQDPMNPANRIPIAVEDVQAYFELARSQGVKRDEDMANAFVRLAENVHPLALGNVHRSIEQIRQLAGKLIALHSQDDDKEAVEERIRRLTTGFYTHNHLINRQEAKDLGLPVAEADDKVEKLMLDYYAQLIADFELRSKFDPAAIIAAAGAQAQAQTVQLERAYIETKSTLDTYVTEGQVSMQQQQAPPMIQMPGMPQPQQQPALPAVATFEITADEWREIE